MEKDLKSKLLEELKIVDEELLIAEKQYNNLKELKNNTNFKELILDGYLTNKAKELISIRYIHSLHAVSNSVESAKLQDDLTSKYLDSMFFLQQYLQEIELNYTLLVNRKADIMATLEETDYAE